MAAIIITSMLRRNAIFGVVRAQLADTGWESDTTNYFRLRRSSRWESKCVLGALADVSVSVTVGDFQKFHCVE